MFVSSLIFALGIWQYERKNCKNYNKRDLNVNIIKFYRTTVSDSSHFVEIESIHCR